MSDTKPEQPSGGIDWNQVAAIVTICMILPYALPFIFKPLYQFLLGVFYRGSRCDAIAWNDLHGRAIRLASQLQESPSAGSERSLLGLRTRVAAESRDSAVASVAEFFQTVWRAKARRVARPAYLDVKKDYLRIDADVLMAAIFLDAHRIFGNQGTYIGPSSSFAFRYGSVVGRFRHHETQHDSYLSGHILGFPQNANVPLRYRGITKDDLRLIARGYPPFYRKSFRSHSGVQVAHPIRTMRDTHRAGWIVAIGFSADLPATMYNSRCCQAYQDACERLLHTLRRIDADYATHETYSTLCGVATSAVAMMNKNSSGSGLPKIIKGTPFSRCDDGADIGDGLNAPYVDFAIGLFNNYAEGPLSQEDRDRLEEEGILEEVLKAAVNGVYKWWQYLNNESSPLPGWMVDERIRQTPIWLDDSRPNPDID